METDTTQVKCKFCYNDGQLIGGNWILLDSIIVTKLYSNTSFFGYVFSSPNKQVTKILKEDALYVSYNDTLYINCHVAMDETLNCYSKAYLGKYDLVFFERNLEYANLDEEIKDKIDDEILHNIKNNKLA